MSLQHICIHFIFSLILFLLNSWLGHIQENRQDLFEYGKFTFVSDTETNFAGNFFQKTVNPTLFLAVICGILQKFSLHDLIASAWSIVPFYWLLRFAYMLVKNLICFVNWKYELFSLCVSLALSEGTLHFLIIPLSASDKSIFIGAEAFRDAFWFAAAAYLVKLFWDLSKKRFEGESVFPDQKRRDILSTRYHKFHDRYGAYIDECITKDCGVLSPEQTERFRCLVYAIMIYEDYCRPSFVRAVEYIVKFLHIKETVSLGVMQVQSNRLINNRQSISLAIAKLCAAFQNGHNESEQMGSAIRDYNRGNAYFAEVRAIYTFLLDLNGIAPNTGESTAEEP